VKFIALIGALCAALAFSACGGSSSGATQSTSGSTESTSAGSTADSPKSSDGGKAGSKSAPKGKEASAAPTVEVPPGPPPKEVVVKDLKTGSGAVLKSGEHMGVYYVGVNYKTGKPFEAHWTDKGKPAIFRYGTGETIKGWAIGLKGMRVGGRRELIVPSKYAYGTGALMYVIELAETFE